MTLGHLCDLGIATIFPSWELIRNRLRSSVTIGSIGCGPKSTWSITKSDAWGTGRHVSKSN